MPNSRPLFLAIALLLAAVPAHSQPETIPPAKLLPNPNAYTYFLQAGKALVDKGKVGHMLSPAEKEAFFQSNARALRLLREGFAYDYQVPDPAYDEAAMRYEDNLRALGRLLVDQGQADAGRGDLAAATENYLGAIRLGIEQPRGTAFVAVISATILEHVGRRFFWEIVPRLDAPTARRAVRRLELFEARRSAYSDNLQAELTRGMIEVRADAGRLNSPAWTEDKAAEEWTRLMQSEMHQADLPYNASTQRPPYVQTDVSASVEAQMQAAKQNAPDAIDKYFQTIRISVASTRFFIEKARAQNALLATSLALRAYQLEHKSYPATLTALAPDYLEQIPTDPFSLKAPLCYQVKGDSYLLYSVGPDGEDDGGTAIPARDKSTEPDSKGDIVAGINIR